MSWTWHWWFIIATLIVCMVAVHFARGATNAAKIAKYGPKADYHADPAPAFAGTITAAAIYAVIITGIAGILF
jgi:hypothetical protein